MNNENKKKIKCVFYMKSGIKIERRIESDAFNDFLTLVKTNREGVLETYDEMQESTILIKIGEIESLQYWD
jgi:hypothetical protein